MNFEFVSSPHIYFGAGKRSLVPEIMKRYGQRVLLVTGGRSFDESSMCRNLLGSMEKVLRVMRLRVQGEPSPSLVDDAVMEFRPEQVDVVLAIGGGSAIDAGKAIAGLLSTGHSAMDFLEGVGKDLKYHGPPVPFVAVPTTAGTGGETSKNAVLSVPGHGGFKKSFRHEQLVARVIIVDPELNLSCPESVTAACGMDAFTQLLESYVSIHASPMTDVLAESGIRRVCESLVPAFERGDSDIEARTGMSYGAFISGLTLANAGLGSVHGLASPIGAFFPVPHGVVCGTLVAEATRVNINAMQDREHENPALVRYADVGRWLAHDAGLDEDAARNRLLETLNKWIEKLDLQRLSDYGISEDDVPLIVANSRGSSMRTNPIALTEDEIEEIVRARL